MTATHSGTLIAKIHRHEVLSTIQPPTTGPIAAATPRQPGPGADRRCPVLVLERRLDQRERSRRQQGGADALEHAQRDELAGPLGEGTQPGLDEYDATPMR